MEGRCEKKAKTQWAPRFLRIYGKRLFIFRDEDSEKKEYPLNILDGANMLVERDGDCTLKMVTHREV